MTDTQLITAAAVRNTLGGVSDMSLWRWLNDPAMNFPKPVVINRRRYWRQADIAAWLEEREAA
jgi:predicted DNA-binding transcriptional regulator AlpA